MLPSYSSDPTTPDPITDLINRLRARNDATATPHVAPAAPPQFPAPSMSVGAAPQSYGVPSANVSPQPVDRTQMTGGLVTDFNNKMQQIANSQGPFAGFSPLDLLPGTSQLRAGVQAAATMKDRPLLGLALLAGSIMPEEGSVGEKIADNAVEKAAEGHPAAELARALLPESGEAEKSAEITDPALLKRLQKLPSTGKKWAVLTAENPLGDNTTPAEVNAASRLRAAS